jgi:PadR family transcriptional regulator, regulatory protein AphA
VLGLIRLSGGATPYQLKQEVATGLGDLWSVPHAQIYREPERLATAGLLTERVEPGGRRRRLYRLTDAGERALDAWLADPHTDFTELRDPGLLKLFLGADPRALAAGQVDLHQAQLARFESIRDVAGPELPEGVRLALEAGIGHEREWVRFWGSVARPPT